MAGAVGKSAWMQGAIPSAPAVSTAANAPSVPVKTLGFRLMEEYVVPLEVIGLLLTAAMIGAVIIALPERPANPGSRR